MNVILLNFYSVKVKIFADSEIILDNLKRDFSYFASDSTEDNIAIKIFNQPPAHRLIPQLKASLYLPGAIVYDNKDTRYVDYNGEALTIYEYDKEKGEIYSADNALLHELAYLLILSRVGELLDKKAIHRIHGLAVSRNGKAVICLLPMGAGKTTLALELLKCDGIRLLSDDIVLIDKKARILPFPLRIGVDRRIHLDIPLNFLREFHRQKYGPKTLVDIEYFKDKIAEVSRPWIILIGEREFSDRAKIVSISKVKTILPFLRDGVIGLGLPQMVEYFLRHNLKDLNKIPIVASRLIVFLKILLRSKVYRFTLGRNKEKNSETLINFIRNV